jgi:glyoxylase-like metal-dependent hydrolase (beta-lactamase superfamily II)
MFLTIEKVALTERVRLFLGGGGNTAVYLHGREALVVDPKMGDFARRLRRGVEDDLGRKVRRIVLTHVHDDHTKGVAAFPDVGAVLVHPNTRARLVAADVAKAQAWVPYADVDGEVKLFLGGDEVLVKYLGVAHTDGDLVVLFVKERVLVAGDLVLNGYEPYGDAANGGDMLSFRKALDELMKLDFDQVVPGHGEVMDRAGAQNYRDYLAAAEGAVREQVAKGASEDEAVAAVRLPQFPTLAPLPMASSREKTLRAMYRGVVEAAKRAGP